jgi:DNA-binding transcriptional LysR family regulator
MSDDPSINPARVDFVTLRLFRAVVETGSITAGAARCGLALSAASRRLSDFEAAAGTGLLVRGARGVTLTPAGHVAWQHATRLFHGFQLFSAEVGEYARGIRGHVRLWSNMSALTEFLPTMLAGFARRHPDIKVEIEEQISPDTVQALRRGIADLGVFAEGTPADGLVVERYQADQLVLVCPLDHPLAAHPALRFADCLDHDFVGLNRGSSLLAVISVAAARAGRALHPRVQVRSFDAMCQMISAGLGVGVLPLDACQGMLAARGLTAVPLSEPWARRWLMLGHLGEERLSQPALLLLRHMRECVGADAFESVGGGSAVARTARGRGDFA